jgi:hypothetical protein
MATYDIHVLCNCGQSHAMGKTLLLEDGPSETRSIAETYKDRVPEMLARLRQNSVRCRESGYFFHQEDDKKLLLVPLQEVSV